MAVHCLLLTFFVLVTECMHVVHSSVGCLDNSGNPVDWFFMYKLPRLKDSEYTVVQDGVGQMYLDTNSQQWTLLDKPITDTNHAVYYTLQQIYGSQHNQNNIAYLLYNDETPSGKQRLNHGHTKGDVCFDKSSGFWLVHSVPKFPPEVSDQYSFPASGTVFGQTFLCVSYNYSQFNVIGEQLLYNYPQLYGHNLPADFVADNNNIVKLVDGGRVEASPWNKSVILLSSANKQFISFAKFTKYGQDLYDSWVAPYLGSELKVETWQNGPERLPSNCSIDYHVLNVETMKIVDESFRNGEDHAKWAVTSAADWICVGDINREATQFHRAGGTVCSSIPDVAKAFRNSIVSVETCDQLKFRAYAYNAVSTTNRLSRSDIL